jgi:glycosyltransferase involved in cell wall biosynthesis
MQERGLLDSVTCRDLDGFFEHVWSVHPFATLVTSDKWGGKYGKPLFYQINNNHTIVEGKIGRTGLLKWIPPLNFLLSQIQIIIVLRKLIKKENIDVIRAGDVLYLGLLGWLLSRLTKIPFLVRIGGNNDKVFETTGKPIQPGLFKTRKIEKAVEKFVLKKADLVAGANQDNLNFALNNGARPEKATLFRYGNLINKLHFIEPDKRTGIDKVLNKYGLNSKQFILYIGRLEAVKHPDDVIKVLSELRKRGFDLKAALVGDGRLKSELKKLSDALGVTNQVIFTGNLDQETLSKLIPAAAIVISPHTGRALSEAALGAVPIVAYNIDWQPELIKTGITGELVAHLYTEGMVEAAIKILSNPSYAKSLGCTVRSRILEMMSPEKLDQHERSQYLTLLSRDIKAS